MKYASVVAFCDSLPKLVFARVTICETFATGLFDSIHPLSPLVDDLAQADLSIQGLHVKCNRIYR